MTGQGALGKLAPILGPHCMARDCHAAIRARARVPARQAGSPPKQRVRTPVIGRERAIKYGEFRASRVSHERIRMTQRPPADAMIAIFKPGDATSILVLALNDRPMPLRDLGHLTVCRSSTGQAASRAARPAIHQNEDDHDTSGR
jgi:hypothetical protein